MREATSARVRFGEFELDLKAGELHKGERKVRLQEQPFQVLQMLVQRAGEVVSREDIQSELWPNDTVVEFDHGINTAIRKLRTALDDSAEKPNYIETVARRGYRFIMPIETLQSSSDTAIVPTPPAAAGSSGGAARSQLRTAELAPGKTVSHYRVLNIIGGGGMGVVYRAEDLRLGRTVALKFLPEEVANDPVALGRFEREARTASSLNHPNICTIYEVEEHEATPFIVMEYLEGMTLRELITQSNIGSPRDKSRKPALRIDEILDIAIQVSDGLDAAHQKQIIHRDIKPANIFVTRQRQVKILDFGLAKLVTTTREVASDRLTHNGRQGQEKIETHEEPNPETNLTREGAYLGTTGYMSPEQVMGFKLDARTDLFCFGLILYELCTGKRAFGAPTKQAFRDAVVNDTPAAVHELNPSVPAQLEQIVNRCLNKDRAQRYQHASDVCSDLKQLRREMSALPTPTDLVARRIAEREQRTMELTRPAAQPETPTRPKIGRWIIALTIVAVAVLAGAFLAYRYWPRRSGPPTDPASVAVLPFTDLSSEHHEEYFSDGLTEELISDFTRVPGLKVTARSNSFQFKGKNEDLRSIARKLNVANILEGTVRREGDRIRITAELTKADEGFQLWSRTYDRQIGDIFAVQDEIARAVVGELQPKLIGTKGPTFGAAAITSPEAYQAFLRSKYFYQRQQPGDHDKALSYVDEAIKLDPRYAPAWALRSLVLSSQAEGGVIDTEDGYRKARDNAEAAIGLDSNLAEAYLALARIEMLHDFDWAAAEMNLTKAAELQPGNATVYRNRAVLNDALGRLDESVALEKQALALDPLRGYRTLGASLYSAGRHEEAKAALKKALELNPRLEMTHFFLGATLLAEGKTDEALAEMEQEIKEPFKLVGEAVAYHAAGRRQDSDTALNTLLTKHDKDSAYQIVQAYAYRNEADKAFEWLERAYQQHDAAILNIKIDPMLKNLRQDPRYAEWLKKMRL